MWFQRNKTGEKEGKTLTRRIREGYWYWESLLANLASEYDRLTEELSPEKGERRGEKAPAAAEFLSYYLKRVRHDEKPLLAEWERNGWDEEVETWFGAAEKACLRRFRREHPQSGASSYRQLRRCYLQRLQQFLAQSDCATLHLIELLSNETGGRAEQELLRFAREVIVDCWNEAEDCEGEGEEGLLPPQWLWYAVFLLTVSALIRAMELDRIRERIEPESELARMLHNTLEEYRHLSQVADRTYDVYALHFTEETGRLLSRNEYHVLLSGFLLEGNDNLYGSYDDELEPLRLPHLALLTAKGLEAEEYLLQMCEVLAEREAVLDFSHPRATCFYIRSLGKSLAPLTDFDGIYTFAMQERQWEERLKQRLKRERLDREKERLVQGDFAGEHLYNQGETTFGQIHSGAEFEQYLQYIFMRLGYESDITKKSGDQGADLILKKHGVVYVVQAKFYDRTVGNKAVQEAAAALRYYEGNRALVVTNNVFTNRARELAKKNEVLLIDRDQLAQLVRLAYSEQAGRHVFSV